MGIRSKVGMLCLGNKILDTIVIVPANVFMVMIITIKPLPLPTNKYLVLVKFKRLAPHGTITSMFAMTIPGDEEEAHGNNHHVHHRDSSISKTILKQRKQIKQLS